MGLLVTRRRRTREHTADTGRPARATTTQAGHYAFLDGLRGWAALAVVLFHLRDRAEPGAELDLLLPDVTGLLEYGRLGVAGFFVLSGFVIAHSLRSSFEGTIDVPNYLTRRVVRLTPPYYAAIVVALVFAFGASVQDGTSFAPGGAPFGWGRAAAHLIYAQELFGYVNFNDVYWTLGLELQFYAVLAGLLWLNQRLRPRSVLPAMYLVNAAFALAWPYGLLTIEGRATLFMPLWYSFLLGVLIFAARAGQIPWAAPVVFAVLLALAPFVHAPDGAFARTSALTGALMMAAVGRDRLGTWLSDHLSQFLGRVSYSLYLIHTPILGAVIVAVTKVLPRSIGTQFLAAAAGVTVSCLAALVMYRLVEKPAMQWSRSLRRPSPATG